MTQTIVVPLDGSERAEQAIPWAAELARAMGHSITMTQVISWPLPGLSGVADAYISADAADRMRADLLAAARDYLGRLKDQLESEGLEAYVEVAVGKVVETILDVADERGASAVAVASHGHGGLTRLMIGSTAQRLAQQALIPVFIVRTGADAASRPRLGSLLIPIDGSALAESAIELAISLAGSESELILARVVELIEMPTASGADVGSVIDWPATEEASAEAEEYVKRQAEALERSGLRTRYVVSTGRAAAEIRSIADESGIDLIVMATHGRTAIQRLMLGSVADDLARHAHQPVLLVSARALMARQAEPFRACDVMTRDVESVRYDEPLLSAARKLLRRKVSGAPVIDETGALVGVVSEHDLIAWHTRMVASIGKDDATFDPADYRARLESDRVSSIMTAPAIVVDNDAPLAAVVRLLIEHRLRRLPVTHDGRVAGVITRSDVLRALSLRKTQLAAAMGDAE